MWIYQLWDISLKKRKYVNVMFCKGFMEKSVLCLYLSLCLSLCSHPETESNTSFFHFLSADDHMCAGFTLLLDTSVCSHPLSLLSSTHFFLIKQQSVSVRVCLCVWGSEERCCHTHRPLRQDKGLMSPARGQESRRWWRQCCSSFTWELFSAV